MTPQISLTLLLFLVFSKINAQIDSTLSGKITIKTDLGFNELVEKYKKVNYSSSAAEGYRVQISTDAGNNAKDISNKVLQEFKSAFSDVSAYIIYQQPNFKVRCGDFRYKSEARKLQKRIASMYPSTFIVKDEIN